MLTPPRAVIPESEKVPLIEKFAFGIRMFAQQMGNNGMNMLAFPAYGIILGLDPAVIGIVFAVMRIFDGILDPLVGWLSDNTRSRWGRRRPWILIGSIVGGVSFALLWQARPEWSEAGITTYFIIWCLFFFSGFTMTVIPTDALGFELTPNYEERTRLYSWASAVVKIALLVFPWMFALTQLSIWENEAQGLRAVGILFGGIYLVTAVLPALFCKERHQNIAKEEGKTSFLQALKLTFKNRTYLLVCGILLCAIFAGQVYMLFGTHLSVYYLFNGDKAAGGNFFGIFGSFSAVVGLIAIICINRFFIHVDKKSIVLFSSGLAFVGWLTGSFLITPSLPWLTLIPISFNAIAVSAFWLVFGALLADVADADEWMSGKRREGMLASFGSFLAKAAGTIGGVIGGIILSQTGFDAKLPAQPEATVSAMKWIYIAFPVVGYGLAFLLALRYPLTKARMAEIRANLEARRGGVAEPDLSDKPT
jgi:GPH family glycoside/pentoside/hexuronide:cation symporter